MTTPKAKKKRTTQSTKQATNSPAVAMASMTEPCTGCCLDCTTGAPAGRMQQCNGQDGCANLDPQPYFAVLVRDPNENGGLWYGERPANLPAPVRAELLAALVASATPETIAALAALVRPHLSYTLPEF